MNIVLTKIPKAFFTEIEETILKCVWNHKRPQTAKAIWREKSKARDTTLLDFKLYHKTIVEKQYCTWGGKRQIDQRNRIESPELNPGIYGQLVFNKEAKNTRWRKDSLFNKWCWKNWRNICRTLKVDPYLTPLTIINSKWGKDLNIRPDAIRILKENVRGDVY